VEFGVAKGHAASLCSREGLPGASADQGALLLCQSGEEVENERVDVGAKLSDQEWHLVSHKAAYEVNVAAEPVQLRHSHVTPEFSRGASPAAPAYDENRRLDELEKYQQGYQEYLQRGGNPADHPPLKSYLDTTPSAPAGGGERQVYQDPNPPRPPANIPEFPAARLAPNGKEPEAFVVHHTSGRGDPASIVSGWRQERPGIGTQYIMDRRSVFDYGPVQQLPVDLLDRLSAGFNAEEVIDAARHQEPAAEIKEGGRICVSGTSGLR
jgi:hypothetical protein